MGKFRVIRLKTGRLAMIDGPTDRPVLFEHDSHVIAWEFLVRARRRDRLKGWLALAVLAVLGSWAMAMAASVGAERQLRAWELALPDAPERTHMVTRAEHPPAVWRRICQDGQNWSPARQRCE